MVENETQNEVQTTQDAHKPRINPAIVLFLFTGILGLVTGGVMLFLNSSGDTQFTDPTAPQIIRDWQAPDFPVQTLDGDTVQLADFRGRTVFLNFWWTGCPPCIRELPAMQQFIREQGDEGAIVLAINQGEDADEISEFLASIDITDIPVLLDQDRLWGDEYGITGYPTTFVIDAEGMVRFRKLGGMELEDLYEYLDAVETPDA